MSKGIRITPRAEEQLSEGGAVPLSIHEYATTGGVTLELEGGIFVNAPFDEWFCEEPEALLDIDPGSEQYMVIFRGEAYPTRVLPLPGYLETRDAKGRLVRESVMSHADRARLSPISGCSFACKFCDSSVRQRYEQKPVDQLLDALDVALKDTRLPVNHVLISGGTPAPRDYAYFDEVCQRVIQSTPLPVDVMMWPRPDDIIDRLAQWGVHGYALNLEIYDEQIAQRLTPQKRRYGLDLFRRGIERAVELTGGNGRVRSLVIVGLEPPEKTLEGVEFLARLGCDPVLSPFRPARGTPLENLEPPTIEILERIYLEAAEIVERYGVKLGPRCIPCQHNTLTFPDQSGAYYYS